MLRGPSNGLVIRTQYDIKYMDSLLLSIARVRRSHAAYRPRSHDFKQYNYWESQDLTLQ